jgi:hypothetical protein
MRCAVGRERPGILSQRLWQFCGITVYLYLLRTLAGRPDPRCHDDLHAPGTREWPGCSGGRRICNSQTSSTSTAFTLHSRGRRSEARPNGAWCTMEFA